MIVSCEAQERADRSDCPWWQPVEHRQHLLTVHGRPGGGNHVPEVGNVRPAKRALGALDKEVVLLQFGEYQKNVQKVFGPAATVD
jgi:hypothetical protein